MGMYERTKPEIFAKLTGDTQMTGQPTWTNGHCSQGWGGKRTCVTLVHPGTTLSTCNSHCKKFISCWAGYASRGNNAILKLGIV